MNSHLARVRDDLETLSTAVGLGQPPLGREDVWAFRSVGIGAALWSAWEWLGLPAPPVPVVGLITSLLLVVTYHLIYARGTTARDRVYRGSWWLSSVLGVLVGGFFVWAKFIAGMDHPTFVGSVLIFSGALLLLLAATDRWRLFFLGWGAPLLLLGFGVPFLPSHACAPMLGLAVGLGGVASSAIISRQLQAAQP